jgi:hypothetical protein
MCRTVDHMLRRDEVTTNQAAVEISRERIRLVMRMSPGQSFLPFLGMTHTMLRHQRALPCCVFIK